MATDPRSFRLCGEERLRQMQAMLAKYDPNQPRVPAGSSAGGQWTSGGGGDAPSSENDAEEAIGRGLGTIINAIGDAFSSFKAMVQDAFSAFDAQFEVPSIVSPSGEKLVPEQVNIFIGGAGDRTVNGNVLRSDALRSGVHGYNIYATNDEASEISAAIQKLPPNIQVNLIGHSWGGDTAARVAIDNPGRVSVLVTVDPVTTFGTTPDFSPLHTSVGAWININAAGKPNRGDASNVIATFGRWGNDPNRYATLHRSVPYNHGDFSGIMGYDISGWKNNSENLNRDK